MFSLKNAFALLALSALFFAGSASAAATPANAPLSNVATLTYNGGDTINASVTVRVRLIEAGVIVIDPAADASVAENDQYDGTIRVRSNTNGPDVYTVTGTVINSSAGHTPSGSVPEYPTLASIDITLGATAIFEDTGASPGNTFRVPNDEDTADSEINGLEPGDIIVINGTEYEIDTGGVDQTSNPGFTVITVTGATGPIEANLPPGTEVWEIKEVQLRLDDVGVQASDPATFDIRTNFINGNGDSVDTDTTITVIVISIEKYVRCISLAALCDLETTPAATVDITFASNDYYSDDEVLVSPSGEIEYLIVMTNDSSSELTSASLTDVLPLFTTYVLDSLELNQVRVNDDTVPGDFGLLGGILVGDTVGRTADTEDDGLIGAGQTIHVVYRVTVDN